MTIGDDGSPHGVVTVISATSYFEFVAVSFNKTMGAEEHTVKPWCSRRERPVPPITPI
jgi:hypothetical protein